MEAFRLLFSVCTLNAHVHVPILYGTNRKLSENCLRPSKYAKIHEKHIHPNHVFNESFESKMNIVTIAIVKRLLPILLTLQLSNRYSYIVLVTN